MLASIVHRDYHIPTDNKAGYRVLSCHMASTSPQDSREGELLSQPPSEVRNRLKRERRCLSLEGVGCLR